MPAFSITIIAKDTATSLPCCLEGLMGLTDDLVIIVDSRSQDTTEKIAGKYTQKVFLHPFSDFASQRNFAVSKSIYDWIFSLDADEIVSPELYDYLKNFSASVVSTNQAFAIKRYNIIFNRIIKHTNWDPDGIVRLFNKTAGVWLGAVHETWHTSGHIGTLGFPIIHRNYQTVEEFMTKLDTYTTIEAAQITKFSLTQFFWLPQKEFIRRFVIHAGFLDGYHGLFLSFLMWVYQITIWVKVWQKEHTTS